MAYYVRITTSTAAEQLLQIWSGAPAPPWDTVLSSDVCTRGVMRGLELLRDKLHQALLESLRQIVNLSHPPV